MNVLSLCDGIRCGRIALDRAGIKVDKYYSSEIDKYANQVGRRHYPNTIELGDMTKWKDWDIDWASIDLVISGTPCQSFSIAGNGKGFEGKSGLFFDFADIYHNVLLHNPNALFLLENVVMKKEWQDIINKIMGVQPIMIDSALVSAQRRKRLYWTNIPNIEQPKDKGVLLNDILEDNVSNSFTLSEYVQQKRILHEDKGNGIVGHNGSGGQKGFIYATNNKMSTLCATDYKQPKQIFINIDYIRRLTPIEYERLQTLPDNYTEGISNTQRYKAIGNGWTVDVIAHIFKYII